MSQFSPRLACIDSTNLDTHLVSLSDYLTYPCDTIVPGHGELLTGADIQANIDYLEAL